MTNDDDDPLMAPLGDGWLRIGRKRSPQSFLVRTEEQDGRRAITALIIREPTGIDSGTMKGISVSALQRIVNTEFVVSMLDERIPEDDRLTRVLTELWAVTAEMAATPASQLMGPRAERAPLERPDGSDPGAFYHQVAEAYRDTLRRTSRIAPVLAEEAGVPVATVRRWIQEARRRGYLPPARQGRAG